MFRYYSHQQETQIQMQDTVLVIGSFDDLVRNKKDIDSSKLASLYYAVSLLALIRNRCNKCKHTFP